MCVVCLINILEGHFAHLGYDYPNMKINKIAKVHKIVIWHQLFGPPNKIYYKKIMDSTKNPMVITDSMELIQDDNQNMSPRKKEKIIKV